MIWEESSCPLLLGTPTVQRFQGSVSPLNPGATVGPRRKPAANLMHLVSTPGPSSSYSSTLESHQDRGTSKVWILRFAESLRIGMFSGSYMLPPSTAERYKKCRLFSSCGLWVCQNTHKLAETTFSIQEAELRAQRSATCIAASTAGKNRYSMTRRLAPRLPSYLVHVRAYQDSG